MTVSSSSNRIPYTGDGVTVAFATPYFLSNADIKAYVDGSLKVLTTDYTLSGAGTSTGGTITFLSAPAAGKSVIILRDADQMQATSLPSNDPFPSKSVETALDKLTMLVQRCRDLLGRSFTLSDSDTSGASLTVPTPSALKFLRWNSGATALESIDIASVGSLGLPVAVSQGGTNATTAAGARSNLGAVGVAGDQMTGSLLFKSGLNNVASAATVNLTAVGSNTAHLTGTTGIGAFTMTSGQVVDVIFDGVLTLTHHVTNNNLPGAANITTAAGDRARYWYDGTTVWCVAYNRADGTPVVSTATIPPPIRQTVLGGPVDSSGYSAFGGGTGSTTVTASGTLTCTAANGVNSSGPLDKTFQITNPSWTGLSTNGTMYLYVDWNSGTPITGSVTLAPTYQWGGTYSTTNNQHTFNIQEMTMKVGNGATASQAYRVFVGEVTVAGGVVTAITWYSLMGRYQSTLDAIAANTQYTYNHNLGCVPLHTRGQLVCQTGDASYVAGDVIELTTVGSNQSNNATIAVSRLQLNIATSTLENLIQKTGTTCTSIGFGNWKKTTLVDRGW